MSCPSKCQLNCIDRILKLAFYKLGHHIGSNPGYYLIVPLLLTALFATGFQTIKIQADPEYLFSPENGPAKTEREIMEQHFPTNFSEFDPSRSSKDGRFGRLFITAADGGSILRTEIWREISFVDQLMKNASITWEERNYTYQQLCAVTLSGYCWGNEVLEIGSVIPEVESGQLNLTYPIWLSPDTFRAYPFPMYMGGFTLSEEGTIAEVKALSLLYFLDCTEPWMKKRGAAWEAAFLATAKEIDLEHIKVYRFTSLTLEQELEENTNSVIPYFSLNIGIMVVFCILTCMMTDWVKSKPALGLLGVASAIFASVSAFGVVMYLGMDFIGINLAAPFLMLGIGIDDTFVVLAAWRRTSVHDPVPIRLGQTYKEAAVSITITSITDMLSFWIGVITPFPCVRIFSVYTGACVVFTYFWHLTFFGGCLAVSGYAEKQNRHALTCCVITPKSQSGSRNFLYRMFCTGGINPQDPYNPKDNKENQMMKFFRDHMAKWINRPWNKALVLIVFVAYLGVSCWGVTQLNEGLEKRRLSRFDSYSIEYYDVEDLYFREYPFRINVIVSGELDYSDKQVQRDLEELLVNLENTTFIDPLYTESWLRSFLDYVDRWKDYPDYDQLKVEDEQSFIKTLKNIYLPGTSFVKDVDIKKEECHSEDCEPSQHIVGTRFVIQGFRIMSAKDEAQLVEDLRAVCDQSKLNVTVFHPYFIYFDQFLIVLPTTIQCVVIAAVIMMVVSLIFIPNPVCSLWVAFSIVSIEVGVLGFMAFWEVHLDSISMINLIMCIGFSVDFAAHISYHYLDSEGGPDDRVRNSLYGLGLPIVQGAISTILGVIGLTIAPSYIFITFFKMIFLVISLGAMHGLFLLPVLLSLFGPGSCSSAEEKAKLRSPSTSYLSDRGSMADRKARGDGFTTPQLTGDDSIGGLRIPRPITMASSLTTTPTTDIETSGSSPSSDMDRQARRSKAINGLVLHSESSRDPSSSSGTRRKRDVDMNGDLRREANGGIGGGEQQQRRMRRSRPSHKLREMYHNNGYLSEEELEEARPGDRRRPMGPLMYFNTYNAGVYPPYMYPVGGDGRHPHPASRPSSSSRHNSRDRHSRSKSRETKKRPKQ